MRVPFVRLAVDHEPAVTTAIRRVLRSGRFILGPEVEAFEAEFAQRLGVPHAMGVASGTDAITLALRAVGVRPGDRVLTSAFSTGYTALAIRRTGALPIFGDVEPGSLCLAPEAVAAALERDPAPAAIVPVHLYGHAGAGWQAILECAARRGIPVIEDACQAHGAAFRGRPLGSFGRAAAFSFYPTKNLGALGDGGLVATDDPEVAERLHSLRVGGQARRDEHVRSGWNSRLDELQAAVLRARLPGLDAANRARRRIAAGYREDLAGLPLSFIDPGPEVASAAHLAVAQVAAGRSARAALRRHLAGAGVATLVHFPRILPAQPAFRILPDPETVFPVAAAAARSVVSLPLRPDLDSGQVAAVTGAVRSFFAARRVSE